MEDVKEKELTETDENQKFPTETDENRPESTKTDENRQFPTFSDNLQEEKPTIFDDFQVETADPESSSQRKFWLGAAAGAAAVGIVAAVAILLILLLRPEPPVEIRTVTETVYVTVEATEATLPPPAANPLTPEDFTYNEQGFMTCTAVPSVLGIDVSSYQFSVDWEQVKEAGVEFAMLRVGYRGYGNGAVLEDEMLRTHYAGATAAGIKVGFYFFSQAITPWEASKEAQFLLEVIEGYRVDMPIVFDWEYIHEKARTAHVTPRILTDCAIAFCERIKEAGYEPMIYFNANQSRRDLYLAELTDYKFWLAMYSEEMTYEYRVDMWQYTQYGRVPGIPGDVDINLYFPKY